MKLKIYSWRMQIIRKDQSITLSFSIVPYFFLCPPNYNQRIKFFVLVIIERLRSRHRGTWNSLYLRKPAKKLLRRSCGKCLTAYGVRFRFKYTSIPRYFISPKHRFIRAKLRARRQRKVRVRNQIPHAVMARSAATVSTPIRLHLRGSSTRTAVKFFLWSRWEQKAEVTFWWLKLTSVTAGTTITTRWLGRPLIPLLPRPPSAALITKNSFRLPGRPALSMLMMSPEIKSLYKQ